MALKFIHKDELHTARAKIVADATAMFEPFLDITYSSIVLIS